MDQGKKVSEQAPAPNTELDVLREKVAILEAVVAEKDAQIEAMERAAKQATSPKAASQKEATIVKLGNSSVSVNHGLIVDGKLLTVEELAKNKTLLSQLAKDGSTAVTIL